MLSYHVLLYVYNTQTDAIDIHTQVKCFCNNIGDVVEEKEQNSLSF